MDKDEKPAAGTAGMERTSGEDSSNVTPFVGGSQEKNRVGGSQIDEHFSKTTTSPPVVDEAHRLPYQSAPSDSDALFERSCTVLQPSCNRLAGKNDWSCTSCNISDKLSSGEDKVGGGGPGDAKDHGEGVLPGILQDQQDQAKTMQDACKTPAKPLFDVVGDFLLGGMYRRREEHQILKNPNLVDLLTKHASDDVVLAWREGAALTMLDVDAHDWDELPTSELLEAVVADLGARPDIWWVTHGRGLKLLYAGTDHRRRALLAATQIPVCFSIELIRNTRHPQSVDTKRPGTRCGEVHFETPRRQTQLAVVRSDAGASDSDRESKLRELGLKEGVRHDHSMCPIDAASDSDAKGCVVVLPSGVFCHRCAAKGVRLEPGMKPGFYPLTGRSRQESTLLEMARVPVHFEHAKHVLSWLFPNMGPDVRESIYRSALEQHLPDSEVLGPIAFKRTLRAIWTSAGWVDPATLDKTTLDTDLASALPACLSVKWKEGEKERRHTLTVRRDVRSNFMHRTPCGYPEIHITTGLRFRDLEGPILQAPDASRFPRKLLRERDRIPLDEAFGLLDVSFPRISSSYLQTILAAVCCAECGVGRLPMLCVTGPTGAGKGETASIAASFLGVSTRPVQLAVADKLFRSIGSSCALGARLFVIDEFSKSSEIVQAFGALLQINRRITWRPLYSTVDVETPCTAPFLFLATYVAEFLETAPEFVRRTRAIRLPRTTPEWSHTCGGDSALWREQNERHALVGNSIVSWVFDLCRQMDFRFDSVCDALGVGGLDDAGQQVMQRRAACDLYRYCRGEFGTPVEIEQNPSFPRGWVDLMAPQARKYVAELVPDLDWDRFTPGDRKRLRYTLSAISWPDDLGINDPVIRADVRSHGRHVGLRFIEDTLLPKGQHRVNCELPAVPDELGVAGVADTPPPEPHVTINVDAPSCKAPPSTEDVLRAGGLL